MSGKNDKYDLLADYLKGRLSGDRKRQFERMLKEDPELSRTAEFVSELIRESDDIKWDRLKQPAHSVLERMLKDYKLSRKSTDAKQGIIFFDSKDMPLPEDVRPDIISTRRVKYRVGDDILEISLYPISPGSYQLIGQLSGLQPGDIIEIEIKGRKSTKKVKSNAFQLFRLERIESGRYNIRIYAEKEVIAKIDIEL
ncbi:MAG TPA: hypothetical protein ENO22_14085 [candidate division Zixibacteria bacterium]|nr:hypothetical protein [candidate division Zixibacteria bacterium]HER00465.1 hypothetical protein [candidate division Zixibacteria bacterium]